MNWYFEPSVLGEQQTNKSQNAIPRPPQKKINWIFIQTRQYSIRKSETLGSGGASEPGHYHAKTEPNNRNDCS